MDVETGQVSLVLNHDEMVWCAEHSEDGKRIISGDGDGVARVWDASNGSLISALSGHPFRVLFARFSPNGEKAITIGGDVIARLWNVNASTQIGVLAYGGRAAFSPDGRAIVVGGPPSPRILCARRPEYWWGVAWLPEFWATLLFAGTFGWSVWRDRRIRG
jgi:WD40 repeat protein